MTNEPEELRDEDGKWLRRDVMVAEMVAENDATPEDVDECISEMVSNGEMNAKTVGESEYIQLPGYISGIQSLAKHRFNAKKSQVSKTVSNLNPRKMFD